jgi:cytochrome c553
MSIHRAIAIASFSAALILGGCTSHAMSAQMRSHTAKAKQAVQGNPATGKVQSTICATCHGAEGISVASNIPNLAGQHYEYLMEQIIAFRNGTRKSAVMNMMVRPMPLPELRNIAAYFSRLRITVRTSKATK